MKDRNFLAQVTVPQGEIIIRPLEQFSQFDDDVEPSTKLRTTGFSLDQIFHGPFTSINKCHSIYEPNYEYTLDTLHKPDKFDSNEHDTCTSGVIFFY